MQYSIIFVGLDVHKDPIDIALADEGRNGEIRFYGTIGRGRYGMPSYDYQTSILYTTRYSRLQSPENPLHSCET
jgi:hypothetical protein